MLISTRSHPREGGTSRGKGREPACGRAACSRSVRQPGARACPRPHRGCSKFNSNISNWDVRNIEEPDNMFEGCEKFNQDLSNWRFSPQPKHNALALNPKSGLFMFIGSPMSRYPQKWPSLATIPQIPPKCMTEAEYETCEKDEETGEIRDFLGQVVERKDAVKLPDAPQCYNRETLRQLVATYGYKNPYTRQPVDEKWLDEQLIEGDCEEAATGGRRHRRKTKKSRNQAKRGGSRKSRKGRKAGRRTRNAKKYAKGARAKATRRHRRSRSRN